MERSKAGGKRDWVSADGGIQLMYIWVSEVCTRSIAYSSNICVYLNLLGRDFRPVNFSSHENILHPSWPNFYAFQSRLKRFGHRKNISDT